MGLRENRARGNWRRGRSSEERPAGEISGRTSIFYFFNLLTTPLAGSRRALISFFPTAWVWAGEAAAVGGVVGELLFEAQDHPPKEPTQCGRA